MTISSLTSNSYYLDQLSASQSGNTSRAGGKNPLAKALDSLQSALESGDTTSAQSILTEVLSHAPKSSSSGDDTTTTATTAGTKAGDEIGTFLKSLQSALASGDTSGAQSILSSLKDYMAANPPPQPPGVGTYSTDGMMTSASARANYSLQALA